MNFIEESDFSYLLLNQVSILDVRSESEFNAGYFPGSINLPILNDEERALVGTTYKKEGQNRAIILGEKLVSGATKTDRVNGWKNLLSSNNQIALYCARGGLRSKISQEWLKDAGITVPRIRGGYKSLRKYLINLNQTLPSTFEFSIIGGKTGSGKTEFLINLSKHSSTIDLEDLAKHRGSAFGNVYGGQPSQSNFENALAKSLFILNQKGDRRIFLESESRRIGNSFIPIEFWNRMSEAKLFILEVSLEERVERISKEYVNFVFESAKLISPDSAILKLQEYILGSLNSIEKHLGSELKNNLEELVKEAIKIHEETGDTTLHKKWIELLLVKYYDPHYEKHIERCKDRIVAKASPVEMLKSLSSSELAK